MPHIPLQHAQRQAVIQEDERDSRRADRSIVIDDLIRDAVMHGLVEALESIFKPRQTPDITPQTALRSIRKNPNLLAADLVQMLFSVEDAVKELLPHIESSFEMYDEDIQKMTGKSVGDVMAFVKRRIMQRLRQ